MPDTLIKPIRWKNVFSHPAVKIPLDGEIMEFVTAQNSLEWKVPMIKGLTANSIMEIYRRVGIKVVIGNKFNFHVFLRECKDMRMTTKSYVVSLSRKVEAHENFGPDIPKEKHWENPEILDDGITFAERMFLGLGYFLTTNKHLDTDTTTICSGTFCDENPHYIFSPEVDLSPTYPHVIRINAISSGHSLSRFRCRALKKVTYF